MLKYDFEELHYQKVTVGVHSNNSASIQWPEKREFQREGTLRGMFFTQGQFIDMLWFGLTVEELHALGIQ